ncbi:hypothetical protein PVA45_08385 (plasmid) [Entomospira entomophila]|uniref:Uncharacterized protein n=1 Tax=Entomospira entomophila TaxID=2719988 RepID=A0A968GFK0_9SPIO|nr:hypothetical protein [Entomospira entomophilus]NIZ41524.1 hypothetical protein [Entomospira entomophilus]WDI36448.1 hypothetical protein PVA45_08385 [Entomospira entomophilus]
MHIVAIFVLINIVAIVLHKKKISKLKSDSTYVQTMPTSFGKLFLLSLRNPLLILLHLLALFFSVIFFFPIYLYAFYLWRIQKGYVLKEALEARTVEKELQEAKKEQDAIEQEVLQELRAEEKQKRKEQLRQQARLEQEAKAQEKAIFKEQVVSRLKEQVQEILTLNPKEKSAVPDFELSSEEVARIKRFYDKLFYEFKGMHPHIYPTGMENFPHEPLVFERIMPIKSIPLTSMHQPLMPMIEQALTNFPSIAYGYVGETKENVNGLFWVGVGHAQREILVIASSSLTSPRYKIYSFNIIRLTFASRPALAQRIQFSLRKYIDDILMAVALTSPNHGLAPS